MKLKLVKKSSNKKVIGKVKAEQKPAKRKMPKGTKKTMYA